MNHQRLMCVQLFHIGSGCWQNSASSNAEGGRDGRGPMCEDVWVSDSQAAVCIESSDILSVVS